MPHDISLPIHYALIHEEISDEIVSVSRALLPAKGSLNEYLDQKVPDWRGNIGKVITPSLLNAKNLKPFFDPEATESIFGQIGRAHV